MIETDVYGCQEASQDVSWNDDTLARRLERRVIRDDKKTVRGNAGIFQIAFDVGDLGYLFGWSGTLTEVRMSSTEIRALLLGGLPGGSAGKGHSERSVDDVIYREGSNDGGLQFSDKFTHLTTRITALTGMTAGKVRREIGNTSDVSDVDSIST